VRANWLLDSPVVIATCHVAIKFWGMRGDRRLQRLIFKVICRYSA